MGLVNRIWSLLGPGILLAALAVAISQAYGAVLGASAVCVYFMIGKVRG